MEILKYKGLEIDPSKLNETVQVKSSSAGALSLQESESGETFVMPRIESIHAGKTANNVYYPAEKLKGDKALESGVYSWTEPYAKPVIYNHDLSTEVTGRVVRAAYSDYTQAGKPGIFVVPRITEPNAVEAVRDGRLLTVSIGANTNSAVCSVCGTDIINEGYCGHMKGKEYDGEIAHWIVGDVFFHELSWVNQPADSNAFVVDTDVSTQMTMSDTKESLHNKNVHEYYGVPKAVQLTEAVAKTFEKEDTAEVKGKKTSTLDSLKEATKKAKTVLEAINVSFAPVAIEPSESVVLVNDGEEIPSGASVSVANDGFTVELDDNQNVVLTADENIDEEDVELSIAISVDGKSTEASVDVAIEYPEDNSEDEPKDDEKDEPENPEEPGEDDGEGDGAGADEPDPETEPEQDPETEPESEGDNEAVDSDPESEPEPEEPAGGETTEDDETSVVIEEATKVIESLQASNDVLKAQLQAVHKELKEAYIGQIITKYDGNLSEEYIKTLEGRKLESLKETIQDLDAGFLNVSPAEKNVEKTTKRRVQKVRNPIQENEKETEKEKEVTENDKVSILARFLS